MSSAWSRIGLTLLTLFFSGSAVSVAAPTQVEVATSDAAACDEAARSRLWKQVRSSDREFQGQRDPQDNWKFQLDTRLVQDIREQAIHLQNQDYVLGFWWRKPHPASIDHAPPSGASPPEAAARMQGEMPQAGTREGPVYLARVGADGLLSIVCEFERAPETSLDEFSVMTPLERLQAHAQLESLTVSQIAAKARGLWGAQTLLEASRSSPLGLSSLSSDSGYSVLTDAIIARRDDILRFYLEHGVSPDMKRERSPERPGWRNDPLFEAIEHGTPDSVHMLLEHDANPNAVGKPGEPDQNTLVYVATWAVEHLRLEWVQPLLERGADPSFTSSKTIEDIVQQAPHADERLAGIHQFLLHGADPNPLILNGFRLYAHTKGRDDLVNQAVNSQGEVQSAWVREAMVSPGPPNAPAEALLNDALAFRDAPDCDPGAPPERMAVCLPNTLKHAEAAFDKIPYDELVPQLDRKCDLHLAGPRSHAGWLSYVLSDQSRALCVLHELRDPRPPAPPPTDPGVAACNTLLDRYRPLASAHPGESPLDVLSRSEKSGVQLAGSGPDIVTSKDLLSWGERQQPAVSISSEVSESVDSGSGGTLEKAFGLPFFMLPRDEGSMHCDNSVLFSLRDGVATLSQDPLPGPEGCDPTSRYFVSLDSVPLYVRENYTANPGMTASLDVAQWRSDHFEAACTITLSYSPRLTNDNLLGRPKESCNSAGCDEMRKAAFQLVAESTSGKISAEDLLQHLTDKQRQIYQAEKAVVEQMTDEEASDDVLLVPYVRQGEVYVVRIANMTVGWRDYADQNVKFEQLKEGKLVETASFNVGVLKGDLAWGSVQ